YSGHCRGSVKHLTGLAGHFKVSTELKLEQGALMAIDRQRMASELTLGEGGDYPGPKFPCRLIGVDVKNLPLTGKFVEQRRYDKLPDASTSIPAADKKIADVVLNIVKTDIVV